MADQAAMDVWTPKACIFESRQQTETLKARRIWWMIISFFSIIGYFAAVAYHGVDLDSYADRPYLIVLAVMTLVFMVLVFLIPCGRLSEIRFSNKIWQAIAKTVFDFLGVYGCFILLSRIRKHTRGICWIYVAGAGFSLGVFRIMSPTFEFAIPNMLAQVGMNESLLKENDRGHILTIFIAVATFFLFLAQGVVDVNWEACTWFLGEGDGHAVVDEEEEVGWAHPLVFCEFRAQTNILRFRRLCWIYLSILPMVTFITSYMYHQDDPKYDDNFPYWIFFMVMIVVTFVLWVLTSFNRLPEIRFRSKVAHTLVKTAFESGGVYACFFILKDLKSHTHGLCWIFLSLAFYSLAFLKVISPSFDFSLPSLLAQVAMNESLDKEHKDDISFKLRVGCACFAIFLFQALLDFGWELFRDKCCNGEGGAPIGQGDDGGEGFQMGNLGGGANL